MNRTRKEWTKQKNSGSYRRKVKQLRDLLRHATSLNTPSPPRQPEAIFPSNSSWKESIDERAEEYSLLNDSIDECAEDYDSDFGFWNLDSNSESESCISSDEVDDIDNTEDERCGDSFADFLRGWAIEFNVPQRTLKPLMRKLNLAFGARLPHALTLKTNFVNKWFMTKNKEIVAMNYANSSGINGSRLIEVMNVFTEPLDSSDINVFQAKAIPTNFADSKLYEVSEVLCKFVTTTVYEQTVFVPLHHTYPENEQL